MTARQQRKQKGMGFRNEINGLNNSLKRLTNELRSCMITDRVLPSANIHASGLEGFDNTSIPELLSMY